jgi:glycosyltransferase involved in cell wall biosynthesis
MKKNIGMILQAKFPPDPRVDKEARSLAKKGFGVFVLCVKSDNKPIREDESIIKINRIDFLTQNKFLKNFYSFIFYLTFYHRFWAKNIKEFIIQNKINVLHVHDLPLVKTAYKVSRKMKIAVVADLHENYPEAIEFYRYKSKGPKQIFFKKKRWQKYEKKYLKKVDKIIAVVEEGKQRIVKYGIPENKVTVISNLEDIDSFNKIKIDNNLLNKFKEKFVIFYVGGFGPHRGIDTAIKSLDYLKDKILNLKLVLVGGGNVYEQEMKNLSRKLNVTDFVDFEGWQPFDKIPSYIEASDICLVPYNSSIQTNASSPNKLFEYMLKGKPVITSDCKSLERTIKETKGGLVFKAGDSKDLAEKIIYLYKNEPIREKIGEAGQKSVFSKYNWFEESKKLIEIYE